MAPHPCPPGRGPASVGASGLLGGGPAVGRGRWCTRESRWGARPCAHPRPRSLHGLGSGRHGCPLGRSPVTAGGWARTRRSRVLRFRAAPLTGHGHHHRLRGQGAADVGREDHRLLLLCVRHLLLRAPGGRCCLAGPPRTRPRQGSPELGAHSPRRPRPPAPRAPLAAGVGSGQWGPSVADSRVQAWIHPKGTRGGPSSSHPAMAQAESLHLLEARARP